MSVLIITKEAAEDLEIVLSPEAAAKVDMDNILTLGYFTKENLCTGCIQFAGAKEREKKIGYLLYLFVLPEYRKTGIAAKLLEEMEKTFLENKVEIIRFLLPDDSLAGRYLEDYGFVCHTDTKKAFLDLTWIDEDDPTFSEQARQVKPLSVSDVTEIKNIIIKSKGVSTKELIGSDLEISGLSTFKDEAGGIVLAGAKFNQPVLYSFGSFGPDPDRSLFAPVCFSLQNIKKIFPFAEALLLSDERIIRWFTKCMGGLIRITPAVSGELTISASEDAGEIEDE